MTAIATRLTKLETAQGADDMDRYIRSLSDEELEAQIAAIDARLREMVEARGIACTGLTTKEVTALAEKLEAVE